MSEQHRIKVIEADGREHRAWTLAGKNVYQILEMMGLYSAGSCAGRGTCGKCKVKIQGPVSEMEANEQEYLMAEEIRQGIRLACCCTVMGDLVVELDIIPPDYAAKKRVLKYQPGLPAQTGVEYKHFFIPGRQNDLVIPLYERIQAVWPEYNIDLSMDNLNVLNRIDRPGRPALELHAVIFGQQDVRLIEREKQAVCGLILDLGTTSLFATLVDLESGELLAMASQTNMQRIYGEDIISRLTYSQEHSDGFESLHKILLNNINAMIDDMLKDLSLPAARIFKLSVVGNPIMLHFFLGLDVAGFAAAPFIGLFSASLEMNVRDIGLNISPLASLLVLPQLGGFVGADTTACLLTLRNCFQGTFLLLDIGTNAEIVLCHRGRLWACSAAAGPAFEGGALSSGMRAGPGAIDQFFFKDGRIKDTSIGTGPVRGICGSGVIDLMAVLLEADCVGADGSISSLITEHFQIREGSRGSEIIIRSADESSNATPIVFNQEDIRQVQLAKGAIRTAIDILLRKARLKAADLEKIYLAGTFGTYLQAQSLIRIGLLPAIDPARIENIGNAAADGAILALMSIECVKEAARIKKQVSYVELAEQADFQEIFLHNLNF